MKVVFGRVYVPLLLLLLPPPPPPARRLHSLSNSFGPVRLGPCDFLDYSFSCPSPSVAYFRSMIHIRSRTDENLERVERKPPSILSDDGGATISLDSSSQGSKPPFRSNYFYLASNARQTETTRRLRAREKSWGCCQN